MNSKLSSMKTIVGKYVIEHYPSVNNSKYGIYKIENTDNEKCTRINGMQLYHLLKTDGLLHLFYFEKLCNIQRDISL
jgi:hypothetical protein